MPPIRTPTYGETPSTLHTPHHAVRATNVSAYIPPPRYRDTTCGYQSAPWPPTAVRQLHPKSRKARSILRCRSFARRPRSRQIHVLLLVWRVVGCGGGLTVRRHSHRRHRVELWRIADWLKNDKKTVESEAEQTPRVYLAFIRQKQGKRALDQLQGSRGEFCT